MRYYIGQKFYYYHKETHKRIYVSLIKHEKGYMYFRNSRGGAFRCKEDQVNNQIFPKNQLSEPFQRNTSAWVNPTANEPKHVNKTPVPRAVPVKSYSKTIGTLKDEKQKRKVDRQKRLNQYWDNFSKPGIQKDID